MIWDTSRDEGTIWVVSMRVSTGNTSARVLTAITTSSSEAFPARSPSPFTVHSTCRAPASTAASEFATAMPRSLWQWVDQTTLSEFGTRSISMRMRSPHRDGTL